jgi:hypothetical protein
MNDDRLMTNDDRLMTAVRDSFAGVHLDIPEEQIAGRGRTLRARRRIPGLAGGALAAAGAAALAVTTVLPPGPASHPGIRLTAWTVAKRSDGSIQVTIREMRDPAGLERRLRADGVPAAVTYFSGQAGPCRAIVARYGETARPGVRNLGINPGAGIISVYPKRTGLPVVLIIRPGAIPPKTGVEIVSPYRVGTHTAVRLVIGTAVVHASQRCAGR